MKTLDAARNKWTAILTEFGVDPACLDHKHHKCPVTGEGEDRFRFSDQNGSGDYFCACSKGGRGGFGLLECKTGRNFAELAPEVDQILGNTHEREDKPPSFAQRLRGFARKSERSAYLASRGLEVAPGLYWATDVEYFEGESVQGRYSAMLAPVTKGREFLTFHVTYIDKGKKANVKSPRKILPGPPCSGGGIELYPAAEEMGVAEGVETAIAAKMIFNCPTHCALNATLLAKWEPPAIAKVVWIFADHDKNFAGQAGAYQLANRLYLKGIEPKIVLPQEPGMDWADVWLTQKSRAA